MTSVERAEALLKKFKTKKPIFSVSAMPDLKKGDRIRFMGNGTESDFIIKKVNRKKRRNGKMEITGFQLKEVKE